MSVEATVKLYRVHQCGYYESTDSGPVFGGLADTMTQLHEWVHQPDRSLSETRTFEIEDSGSLDPTYCFDIVNSKGNADSWLLVTWNETHNDKGRIPTVDGDSQVGHSTVTVTDVPQGRIPGYPTYFWIVPSRSVLATIRFNNPRNGHQNLKEYLKEFLWKHTTYVIEGESEEEDTIKILGHAEDLADPDPPYVVPRFDSRPMRAPGKIDIIRNQREKIRRVKRRNSLNWQVKEDKDLLLRLLSLLGTAGTRNFSGEVKTHYDVPFSPTEEELEILINEWEAGDDDTKWDDIGFQMKGEQNTYWLGHSFCRDTFQLDVELNEAGIVNSEELLAALGEIRDDLLSLVE